MTLKELLKDYISGEKKLPVKIVNTMWTHVEHAYNEVIFISEKNAVIISSDGTEFLLSLYDEKPLNAFSHYEFYEVPKKTKKIAPYYYRSESCWNLSGYLFELDADFSKIYPAKEFKRCTALEIEV